MQVKIGDFGLACIENLNVENQSSKSSSISSPPSSPVSFFIEAENDLNGVVKVKDSNEHTKGVGTSLYASPEQLKGKVYDTKVSH